MLGRVPDKRRVLGRWQTSYLFCSGSSWAGERGGTFWEEERACCRSLEFPEPDGLSKMADVSLAGLEVVGLERGSAEGKCPQGLSIVGSVDLLGAEAGSQGGGWGSGSPDRDRETGRAELGSGRGADGAGRGLGEICSEKLSPSFPAYSSLFPGLSQ